MLVYLGLLCMQARNAWHDFRPCSWGRRRKERHIFIVEILLGPLKNNIINKANLLQLARCVPKPIQGIDFSSTKFDFFKSGQLLCNYNLVVNLLIAVSRQTEEPSEISGQQSANPLLWTDGITKLN